MGHEEETADLAAVPPHRELDAPRWKSPAVGVPHVRSPPHDTTSVDVRRDPVVLVLELEPAVRQIELLRELHGDIHHHEVRGALEDDLTGDVMEALQLFRARVRPGLMAASPGRELAYAEAHQQHGQPGFEVVGPADLQRDGPMCVE